MFAGEGTPERTNRRFHYISDSLPAKRLSTAFDSVPWAMKASAPAPTISGRWARVSTLLMMVGLPKRPLMAGKGGLLRGWTTPA